MMVECPKCKFTQPKDRYCANCGLDIDSFKPAPKPVLKRLLNNPYFYIFGVASVVAIMISFIHFSQDSAIEEAILTLPNAKKIISKNRAEAKQRKNKKVTVTGEINIVENLPTQTQPTNTATPTTDESISESSTSSASNSPLEKIHLRFSDVPIDTLDTIFSEATQTLYESDNVKVLTLKRQIKPSSLADTYSLGGDKTISVKDETKINLNFMRPEQERADEGQTGLLILLTVDEVLQDSIKIRTQANISIRDDEDNLFEDEFINSFNLPRDKTVIIAGLVPHKKIPEKTAVKYSTTPLSILSSPTFLSSESEFVIFLWAE